MYYTPQFTDRQAKSDAVAANTVDMMAEYIQRRLNEAGFTAVRTGKVGRETRRILVEWVDNHPDATLEAVSDQLSDMVRDLLEYVAEDELVNDLRTLGKKDN